MPTSFSHRPPRNWLQVDLSVPKEFAEYASHHLTEITGNGVQLLSSGEKEIIIGYLEKDENYLTTRKELDTFFEELEEKTSLTIEISLKTIVEENWAENWKENYKPSKITDSITVKPTWETYTPAENEVVIEIDPGMAFGTGLHSSTRLALTFIDQLFSAGETAPKLILDVGTGTGVLAIAAAKLGAQQVTAIDNDIDAVVAAQENIGQNKVGEVILCSDRNLAELAGSFDLVIANITADVLTQLCKELVGKVTPGGHLILAGILQGAQADNIIKCFQDASMHLADQKTEGKWISLLFSKGPLS